MIKIVLENLPLFVYEISLTRPFSKATFTNLFYYFPILSYEALKCIVSSFLLLELDFNNRGFRNKYFKKKKILLS